MRKILLWAAGAILLTLIVGFAIGYTPDTDRQAMRAKHGGPTSSFVDIGGGLTVHVRDTGPRTAPAIVLLHGSNASLHTWEPWAERLGRTHRIVRFDFPGHGLTGADPKGVYSPAAFAEVTDRVTHALGLSRFALGGNSMGGGVAWRYAAAHPDKVSALILVDASGAPYDRPEQAELPLGFRLAMTPGVREVVQVITPRSMIAQSLRQSVSNQAVVTDATIDLYWELLRYPGNRRATLDRFALPYAPATTAEISQLTMPTLILWGAQDKLIPAANARWFASVIPGARAIVYPGIGHLPMEEAADRSAADVARFLEATETR